MYISVPVRGVSGSAILVRHFGWLWRTQRALAGRADEPIMHDAQQQRRGCCTTQLYLKIFPGASRCAAMRRGQLRPFAFLRSLHLRGLHRRAFACRCLTFSGLSAGTNSMQNVYWSTLPSHGTRVHSHSCSFALQVHGTWHMAPCSLMLASDAQRSHVGSQDCPA